MRIPLRRVWYAIATLSRRTYNGFQHDSRRLYCGFSVFLSKLVLQVFYISLDPIFADCLHFSGRLYYGFPLLSLKSFCRFPYRTIFVDQRRLRVSILMVTNRKKKHNKRCMAVNMSTLATSHLLLLKVISDNYFVSSFYPNGKVYTTQ